MKRAETAEGPEVSAPTWTEPETRTSPEHATPSPGPSLLPAVASTSTSRDRARYTILAEHGRGGLGRVFRARDVELGRDVAIKELIVPSDVSAARFLREALITARLEHPGIVPVHEAGRWSDGTPFYAMKLVAGRPLSELLAERRAAEQRLALLHHVIAVADAIAYAHDRGVIHRDLKPSNVIVGEFGETVVIDWGLAKEVTASDGSLGGGPIANRNDELTSAGDVLGTPAYMSPEQQRGEPVDRRTDVFAIGVMLWELGTLHKLPPNYSGQRERILRQAGVDADLAAIIYKALDPDPDLRYADAGALATDLKAFKAGVRIGARSYSLFGVLAHWTRRHRAMTGSALAVLALAAAGATAYVRSIASERDLVNEALRNSERERARADAALGAAKREQDRARLSEAAAVMDRDPAQASGLLATLALHSPQYALLTARADQLVAAHVVAVPEMIDAMYGAPEEDSLEIVAGGGRLYEFAPESGALVLRARDVTVQMAHQPGGWLYTRRSSATGAIEVARTGSAHLVTTELPSIVRLVATDDAAYALDRDGDGDLYELVGDSVRVFAHQVRQVTAGGDVLIVCHSDDTLRVWKKRSLVFHGRCPVSSTLQPAVARDAWATFEAGGVLTAERHGQRISLRTSIAGDYEIAVSEDGVVAIADYARGGSAWYLRADGTTLEHGPSRAANLYSVAASGRLAAWGYTDGALIVLDTESGTSWQLRGVHGKVTGLYIDAARARIIAGSKTAIWVWKLPMTASLIATMPCRIKHIQPSSDGQHVALDCDNGGVRVWSRVTGTVTQAHAHPRVALGVAWWRDKVCSGGFLDGQVMCSSPDGAALETAWAGSSQIFLPSTSPGLDGVVFASGGKVWRFDGQLRALYAHESAYRTAISPDGRMVGSGSFDGSLAVYDAAAARLVAHVPAHRGSIKTIAWVDSELWTSGNDGELRRWQVDANGVVLRHALQVGAGLDLLQAKHGRWAASIEERTLVVGRGDAIELRLDLGRKITAIELSPDQRYVAAGIEGEIAVIDLARHALATLTASAPVPNCLSFVTPTELAFSEDFALKKLDVDQLAYTPFRTDEQSDPAR